MQNNPNKNRNPEHEPDEVGGYELLHKVTGIKPETGASMVHRGQLPYYRLGKRIVRFKRSELERWMQAGSMQRPEGARK